MGKRLAKNLRSDSRGLVFIKLIGDDALEGKGALYEPVRVIKTYS